MQNIILREIINIDKELEILHSEVAKLVLYNNTMTTLKNAMRE